MVTWETSLGSTMRDVVTGFEGVAIARSEYLNGCQQFCLKPTEVKDGKVLDGEWIDVGQLEMVGQDLVARFQHPPGKNPGGPMSDAPKGL